MLAHRKLGVVVILENRALFWKKHQKSIAKNNKTSTHKDKWLSILWLENRVALRKNAAIKRFKQQIKWYTIPPPGGGGGEA